ncbi:MAG: hypothetical protein RXO26_06310 [Caldivirga sp.]
MWTLIGGNVRMLDEVIMLSWDMKTWLNEQVIAAICDAFKKY